MISLKNKTVLKHVIDVINVDLIFVSMKKETTLSGTQQNTTI